MANLFVFLFFIAFICLVLGLIKPSIFTSIAKRELTRKQISLFFGGSMFLFFVLVGITAEPIDQETQSTEIIEDREEVEEATEPVEEDVKREVQDNIEVDRPELEITGQVKKESETTLGERNALKKAKDYLNYTAFSRDGLIEQLEYEGFTHQQAIYGADNSGANWNEQATKKAKDYLNYTAFSRDGLIEQLEYEGFTHQQAIYGAEAVGY